MKFTVQISETELIYGRSAMKMFARDKSRPGALLEPSLSRASLVQYSFIVDNPWFNGNANLLSYASEELIATKFLALLQRRKDRDLFDLGQAFDRLHLDDAAILSCFQHYLGDTAPSFTRANVEEILLKKLSRSLVGDIKPLLPSHVEYKQTNALQAFKTLWLRLVVGLPGAPWKKSTAVIEQYHPQS